MFNLSVLHVWFKILDGITMYIQIVYSSCLVQNFWMETPCMFSLSTSYLVQQIWIESPFMFNLSVLHVWFTIFGWNHPLCSTCLLHVWFKTFRWNHPVYSTCLFFMPGSKLGWNQCMFNLSGSKLSDGIFLYVQFVSTSCLVQNFDWTTLYVQFVSTSYLVENFWMESPCIFKLSILHVWFTIFGLNHPVCSICQYFMSGSKLGWNHLVCLICQYFMSGSKLLDGITLYVQLVSTSYLVQNLWMESPCMFILSTSYLDQQFWIESPCIFNLSVLHACFKAFVLNHPVCSTCQYLMSGTQLLDGIILYVQLVST
jgi:hypothetical protein